MTTDYLARANFDFINVGGCHEVLLDEDGEIIASWRQSGRVDDNAQGKEGWFEFLEVHRHRHVIADVDRFGADEDDMSRISIERQHDRNIGGVRENAKLVGNLEHDFEVADAGRKFVIALAAAAKGANGYDSEDQNRGKKLSGHEKSPCRQRACC